MQLLLTTGTATGWEAGGALLCTASAGSKNYCVAILGGSDEDPLYTLGGTNSLSPTQAGTITPGGVGVPAGYTPPSLPDGTVVIGAKE